jgi:hypothetical protein
MKLKSEYKTFMAVSYKFYNKLECSPLASLSKIVVFAEPTLVKHLSGAPLQGKLLDNKEYKE